MECRVSLRSENKSPAANAGPEAEVRQVATRQWRWRRAFCAGVAVAFLALLTLSASVSRSDAQPFASVVMDVRTGDILQQTDNATARLHPASLTKMMTLYIAFEALENGEITLDTRVRISRHAASQPRSRLGLRAGQTIAMRYLIRAAALRSANDAAVAIAEAIEGSVPNFAQRMNRTARAIGMSRTTFVNPHGLTAEGHLSTARDMALLGRQLYFDFPQYYNIFSRRSEDAGIEQVTNTNRRFLDGYRGADGIKTGFTSAAGYNLVAMAERDGVRILVAVFGGRSSVDRQQRVTDLMDRGFRMAPRRASIRRPARPDYVRAPEDRGTGPAAGRVIRLQTAPQRSPFPRARPLPGTPPSEDLIASLRDGIDEVIADIREPDPTADTDDPGVASGVTSEEPEGEEEPVTVIAAAAPQSSPVPRPRPGDGIAARAAGFTVIDPQTYAALTEDTPEEPVTQTELPAPAVGPVTGVTIADGLILIPGLPAIATAEAAPVALPEDPAQGAVNGVETITQTPLSELQAAETGAAGTGTGAETGAELAPDSDSASAEPPITDSALPGADIALLAPGVGPELSVGPDGRVLWRDEELLTALEHEDPAEPVLAPTIVLTSSDSENTVPLPPPMPEIISRVAPSGGRLWGVDLGLFPSRSDAERLLLRLALSESATLSNGIRRVTPRSGRYAAEVVSLAEDQAQLACLRLAARDQACTVVEP